MNFGKADDHTGAILYKDDFSGADLIQEQISKAIINEETKLLDYLQSSNSSQSEPLDPPKP